MPSNDDPLASLREELGEEDEPLFPSAPKPAQTATAPVQAHVPSRATPAAGKPAAGPPPLPPPLPKAKTGGFPQAQPKTGSVPAAQPSQPGVPSRTGIVPPNASPAIAALQQQALQPAPAFAIPNLPPMVQRPAGADPFQEPAEPRIPVGVDS
ncbi:MAG: hypothetical protein ACOZQL_43600, partial [Myxococcota bacterium]